MSIHFSFEDLDVWKRSVTFTSDVIKLLEDLKSDRKHFRLSEQLESAVTSISLNIAEGKGRYSKKEFVQFLYYSRGSLFETITLLEIFKLENWIDEQSYNFIRKKGDEIGKMISTLINSIKNPNRH